jgi:hypothetical protein
MVNNNNDDDDDNSKSNDDQLPVGATEGTANRKSFLLLVILLFSYFALSRFGWFV